jgi:hypothetical protein
MTQQKSPVITHDRGVIRHLKYLQSNPQMQYLGQWKNPLVGLTGSEFAIERT